MKVNTNSWHFKVYKSWDYFQARDVIYGYKKISLCRYFWTVVFALLVWLVLVGIALGMAAVIISGAWGLVVNVGWWAPLAIIAGLAALIAAFVGFFAWLQESQQRPGRQQNIVFEYAKAKKRRVCPILEPEAEE